MYVARCPICLEVYSMSEMEDHLNNNHKHYEITKIAMKNIKFIDEQRKLY